MNCQQSHKIIEAVMEGQLNSTMEPALKHHLQECSECAQSYRALLLAQRVIEKEKSMVSNPFLATRIMASVEALQEESTAARMAPSYRKVLRPAVVTISVLAAIFMGVILGGTYKPVQPNNMGTQQPIEMQYMNDAAQESLEIYSNE